MRYLINNVVGKVYSRPQLDSKTREMCTISALMSLGVAPDFIIQEHFRIGLSMASLQEVRELIVQLHWIVGWPAFMRMSEALHRFIEEKGMDKSLQPIRHDYDKVDWYKEGMETGKQLHGASEWDDMHNYVYAFEPGAAAFLVENIYGEVLNRPSILDPKIRQLCYIASVIALNNTDALKLFIPAALNVGCSPEEIKEVIFHMSVYRGWPSTLSAIAVYNEVMQK